MTAEALVSRLMRTEPPNEKMFIGTAFHTLLENCVENIDDEKCGEYNFKVTCDADIEMPQIKEIRASKEYFVDGQKTKLTGKCDGITGNQVTDYKLTFNPKPENYFDSYQWRSYLDIFDADVFTYCIFSAKQKDKEIEIYDASTLTMYRYPNMVDDLITGIRNFVEFVKHNAPDYGK
jgi:hypothetical protein